MDKKLLKKQMLRLFLGHLVAFALLFTLLGVVVFRVTNASMYSDVDASLKKAATDDFSVEREINFLNNADGPTAPNTTDNFADQKPQNKEQGARDLQQVVLLWDAEGNLLNEKALGVRFSEYSQVTLNTEKLAEVTALTYADDGGATHNLHQIVFKATNSALPKLAYVQVLVNTDQVNSAMKRFQLILWRWR